MLQQTSELKFRRDIPAALIADELARAEIRIADWEAKTCDQKIASLTKISEI